MVAVVSVTVADVAADVVVVALTVEDVVEAAVASIVDVVDAEARLTVEASVIIREPKRPSTEGVVSVDGQIARVSVFLCYA